MRLCFLRPKMFWLSSASSAPQSRATSINAKYHAVLSLCRPTLSATLQDPVFFEEKSTVLFISAFPGPSRSPSSSRRSGSIYERGGFYHASGPWILIPKSPLLNSPPLGFLSTSPLPKLSSSPSSPIKASFHCSVCQTPKAS